MADVPPIFLTNAIQSVASSGGGATGTELVRTGVGEVQAAGQTVYTSLSHGQTLVGTVQQTDESGFILKVGSETARIESSLRVAVGEKVSFEQFAVRDGRPVVRLTVITQQGAQAEQNVRQPGALPQGVDHQATHHRLPDAVVSGTPSQRSTSGQILHGSPVSRTTIQGSTVTGQVISRETPSPNAPPLPQPLDIVPGQAVSVKVNHVILPNGALHTFQPQSQTAGAAAVDILAPGQLGQGAIQGALGTHQQVTQQALAALGVAGQAAAAAAGGAANAIFPAIVLQSSAAGVVVLVGPYQLFLPVQGQPPVGSVLGLEISGQQGSLLAGDARALPGAHEAASHGRFLATLDRLLKVDSPGLSALVAAPVQATVLSQAIPQATTSFFSSALLLLLFAVRGKSVQSWLGEGGERDLERGLSKSENEQFSRQFQALEGRATGPGGKAWRSFTLPVRTGDQLDSLAIFTRDDEDGEAPERRGGEGKRFVIEAHFSRTGQVQFDALLREPRLLLVVRSITDAFDAETRNDIREIFNRTSQSVGLQGSLEFVQVAEFPVRHDASGGDRGLESGVRDPRGGVFA